MQEGAVGVVGVEHDADAVGGRDGVDVQGRRDRAEDPRFKLTAAQLEEQGIEDFQLDYALRTLRRTGGTVVARR